MKAKTIIVEDAEHLEQALKNLEADFQPNLAFVFSAIKHSNEKLQQLLSQYEFAFIGASTAGEIALQTTEQEMVFEDAISVLLLQLKPELFQVKQFDIRANSSFSAGIEVGKWGRECFAQPGYILLASGLATDGEALVKGIIEGSQKNNMPLYGGLAGDDGAFSETFVYGNKGIDTSGIAVVVFDTTKMIIQGLASSGWVGSGSIKQVTRSQGNIVYSIDNKPALDFYISYLNIDESDMPAGAVEFPLLVHNEDGSTILRTVVDVNLEERSLIFAGSVEERKYVQFSMSNGDEASENTIADIREFRWLEDVPDAMLLFSCVARHTALGPTVEDEIEVIGERWPVPLAGYFTYGEIGQNSAGSCDFHNETCTLVLMKEK